MSQPTHADLVAVAARWLRRQGCGVVLTECRFSDIEQPDAIGWKYGESWMVECKVSRADFLADRKKPARQRPRKLGNRAFYLTVPGIVRADDVTGGWGLLEVDGRRVRRVADALPYQPGGYPTMQEIRLLLSELRRYQAQGIKYRKLGIRGGYADGGALGSLAELVRVTP